MAEPNVEMVTEVTYTPVPYIALLGLNATQNAVHSTIWNAFTVNRQSDRCPLYFKLFAEKFTLIAAKQKKSSYEWHIPKGILKTNWLQKHLFEVPSVVVLFVDLDWDDLHWNERRTECVAKVEYLRRSLHPRNTRISLVLIQMNAQLPSDDSVVTERAALLCSSCDLQPKSLFVLPVNDMQQLMGYILRMENAFFEFAKMYYQHEYKLVKAHREQLNKTTHQLLYVRHQFKMAFFNELKQDFVTALKHYKQSYANLMEVRVSITNLYEIKTIGGFINYKICKLCFQLNTPLDAISQFRKHIDIFKNKSEPKELEFEHTAWLSKQYLLFGDLFDHAILALGLVPSQIQHPGYYYYESALQAMQRRKFCQLLLIDSQHSIINSNDCELYNSILQPTQAMEFFGQRPWRPGCQTLEPLDSDKEKIGLRALQYKELTSINHSAIVITLLSNAINQFKKYKCQRMKRYLMVLVGEEYYQSKDYLNALTFLMNVLPQYRQEKWQLLTEKILKVTLKSAYLSADFSNFVRLGLESITIDINIPSNEKELIQSSIENVMKGQLPLRLPFANELDVNYALELWNTFFQTRTESIVFTIKMDSFMKFIDCKPKFKLTQYFCDQSVILEIYLSLNCLKPLKFSKLNVVFSNQYYNQFCEIGCEQSNYDSENLNNLVLIPNKLHCFTFNIIPLVQDIGRDITVIGVNITLGDKTYCAVLQWSFIDINHDLASEFQRLKCREVDNIKQIFSETRAIILQPTSKVVLSINNESIALLDEYYPITLSIKNSESCEIRNITLHMKIISSDADGNDVETRADSFDYINSELTPFANPYIIDNIKSNGEMTKLIILKLIKLGVCCVNFTVNYDATYKVGNEQKLITNSLSEKISIQVLLPFSVMCEISNLSDVPVNEVRLEEPYYATVSTKLNKEFAIFINNVSIELNDSINLLDKEWTKTHESGDIDEKYKIMCSKQLSSLSIGTFRISWKRKDSIIDIYSDTSVILSQITVVSAPIFVELISPKTCVARNPVLLKYNIYNRTNYGLSLELSMGTSDNFMYSGNKLIQVTLPARQTAHQNYIMYPLICGSINLPKFRIVINPETANASAVDYIDQILPSSLLVLPQNKMLVNGN